VKTGGKDRKVWKVSVDIMRRSYEHSCWRNNFTLVRCGRNFV
jgi:hypothetical protein